ncbi:MAG: hypothetical protein ACK56F_21195, partial [bacterium]
TLDNTGITYGSGVYEVFFSSRNSTSQGNNGDRLFDFNDTVRALFLSNNYATTSGALTTQGQNYWLVENTYRGDWVCIRLPEPISMTSFQIIQDIVDLAAKTTAPRNIRLYCSNDGINWITIQTYTNLAYNSSGVHTSPTISGLSGYIYYA